MSQPVVQGSVEASLENYDEKLYYDAPAAATGNVQRQLYGHGMLQLFAGCMGGLLPVVGVSFTPVVGVVHKIGTIQGAVLLGAAGGWHLLPLTPRTQKYAGGWLVSTLWCNLTGIFISAITLASGALFDPSFDCSLPNTAKATNVIVALLLNLVLPVLAPFLVCAGAALAPATAIKMGETVGWVLNGIAVVLTIAAILLTALLPTTNTSLDTPVSSFPNATTVKVPTRRLYEATWSPASIHGHGSRRLSEEGEPLVLCPFAYRGSPGPKMVGGWVPEE